MPTDGNGVYSLPGGYLATAGLPVLPSEHNPPLEDIALALTGRLCVSGANAMTGPLKLADGAVGAPSLALASATGTGFYKTTAGLGFATGGVKTVEFGAGGIIKGARYIGEIFDWTLSTAPALCVLPFGQTLSRAAYPDLWIAAQAEIALGNIFYNNGDGSTTFGIGDCRGRVRAGKDNMGGVAAGRLTSLTMTPDGNTIGAVSANNQTYALGLTQLPTGITSVGGSLSASVSLPGAGKLGYTTNGDISPFAPPNTGAFSSVYSPGSNWAFLNTISGTTATQSVTSNNTSGLAHPNVQPTLITNCALFAGA